MGMELIKQSKVISETSKIDISEKYVVGFDPYEKEPNKWQRILIFLGLKKSVKSKITIGTKNEDGIIEYKTLK